jgi:uncharacterized protein YecT (DUF1311 family)
VPAQAGQGGGIAGSRRGDLPHDRGEALHGGDETGMSSRRQIECLDREGLVWDKIINHSYKTMMNGLEPDQQAKLREMQRSWIHTRDLTCAFWYDYFQGNDGQSDDRVLQTPPVSTAIQAMCRLPNKLDLDQCDAPVFAHLET